MLRSSDRRLALGWVGAALCVAPGCLGDVETDASETTPVSVPVAEFDPAQSIVPLPSALLMNPATGRLNVPASCTETPDSAAAALRAEINQLDGFGASKLQLVATFSEPLDPASLDGRVFLVRIADHGVPLNPPQPVPSDVATRLGQRATPDCSGSVEVPELVIAPRAALPGSSTYAVWLRSGVRTAAGEDVLPSPTWALVRQSQAPVAFPEAAAAPGLPSYNATPFDPADPQDLASLRGLDQLWRAHAPLLGAVDQLAPVLSPGQATARSDILLAWAFDTQTTIDPLDASVDGSPSSNIVASAPALTIPDLPAAGAGSPVTVEQAYAVSFPGVPCASLGCDAIGALYAAGPVSAAPTFTSSSYLGGDDCAELAAPSGAFDDPRAPTLVCQRELPVVVVVPLAAAPAEGYPTVIFGHGLGRSKEDLLALAGGLARAGIASVAVDALDHGERAVRTSSDAAAGCDRAGPDRPCADALAPTCAPQCYAPLLSSDLAVTRDHLRQTVLDHIALGRALTACAEPGACGSLQVDPARIGYVGQSLGALIGGMSIARSPDVSAGVLNVGGADWMQIVTDTATPGIRCPLVDALIASGALTGEPWNLGANPNALCLGEAWKTDPGYLQFVSAARWLLDPADAVNHVAGLAQSGTPAVLVAEVVGDPVIPNSATDILGGALGLTPVAAQLAGAPPLDPTPAATTAGSSWIRYANLDADPATMFPGNAYAHGSLLAPATPSSSMLEVSGQLGTARMQVDTIGFLVTHLGGTP